MRSSAISRLACGSVTLLLACGPAAPPPSPPPIVAAPAATPEPPPTPVVETAAPAAPEPPPFVPAAPFSIVAEVPGSQRFATFPLEDGAAIVASAAEDDPTANLRLAVLDHDEIAPAPALSAGLPAISLSLRDEPLIVGRWPDALVLSTGAPCQVHAWQRSLGRWEQLRPHTPPDGKCERLTAWTPGAALAMVQGPKGASLVGFGAIPKTVPALPPRSRKEEAECQKTAEEIHSVFAAPTGDVVVLWHGCGSSRGRLTHWRKGAAKGETLDARVNLGIPTSAHMHSGTEIVIDGDGERTRDEVRFTIASGRLRHVSSKPVEKSKYYRLITDDRSLGLPPRPESSKADGFHTFITQLTSTGEIFVMGHVQRGGKAVSALLLRDRPVKKALVWP